MHDVPAKNNSTEQQDIRKALKQLEKRKQNLRQQFYKFQSQFQKCF